MENVPIPFDKTARINSRAWVLENAAIQYRQDGNIEAAEISMRAAKETRLKPFHDKFVTLCEFGDAQNEIIDIGLQVGRVPEFDAIMKNEGNKTV